MMMDNDSQPRESLRNGRERPLESLEHTDTQVHQVPLIHPLPPKLRAGPALAVFAIYLVVQLLVGAVVGIVGVTTSAFKGINVRDPEVVAEVTQSLLAPASAVGMLLAGSIVIVVSVLWFREEIHDQSASGAAWIAGEPKNIIAGFGLGILIAITCLGIVQPVFRTPDIETMGPVTRMAATPGIQQTVWVLLALLFAPPSRSCCSEECCMVECVDRGDR
jgi:hypothetical protein